MSFKIRLVVVHLEKGGTSSSRINKWDDNNNNNNNSNKTGEIKINRRDQAVGSSSICSCKIKTHYPVTNVTEQEKKIIRRESSED